MQIQQVVFPLTDIVVYDIGSPGGWWRRVHITKLGNERSGGRELDYAIHRAVRLLELWDRLVREDRDW